MLTNELPLFLVGYALIFFLFLAFVFTGRLVSTVFKLTALPGASVYGSLFYHFISGLLLVISLYAIIVSRVVTVNVFILPLLLYFYKKNKAEPITENIKKGAAVPYVEMAFISLLVLVVLHLFPVTEYKQADSFFYLKIAESLNATGQENISHYFNIYDSSFHGVEPYHYFEIWITAFIIRFTEGFMPSILIERFVTYGILLTGLIAGLYMLAEEVCYRKLQWPQKLLCWSLLFIFPNVLAYFPKLYQVFISDFEGNVIDRPNFRIIYLLLVPVLSELHRFKRITSSALCFLLMLCVVSFQFFVVCIPSVVLYGLYVMFRGDQTHRRLCLTLTIFSLGFALFYVLFPVASVPSFFQTGTGSFVDNTLRKTPFILFSISTSLVYIALIALLLLAPLLILDRKHLFKNLKHVAGAMWPLVLIAFCGLVMARTLFLKDNAYQFLFIAHIIVTLLIWWLYLLAFQHQAPVSLLIGASIYLSMLWMVHWITSSGRRVNIFQQNKGFVYQGANYSAAYMDSVKTYLKTQQPIAGAYIGDTSFYNNTYYSRRNPNVYFLPVTYIVAASKNHNIEFCLSDTSALLYGIQNPVFSEYLHNAISRNIFYRYRLQHPSLNYGNAVTGFISENKLPYLIATKDFNDQQLKLPVVKKFTDPNTGEKFIILNW